MNALPEDSVDSDSSEGEDEGDANVRQAYLFYTFMLRC